MMKQPGMFSNRYLIRKGKENLHQNHNTHHDETDFPLAYTSTKYASREKSPIPRKKKQEKKIEVSQIHTTKNQHNTKNQQNREEATSKLQKQLKDARELIKKLNKDMANKNVKHEIAINQLKMEIHSKDDKINTLNADLKKESKKIKDQNASIQRYRETIKKQIYWLLSVFASLQSKKTTIEDIKAEISSNYKGFLPYIEQLNIQKQLQQLASSSSMNDHQASFQAPVQSIFNQNNSKINMDSMFTEQFEDNHLVKIMELQPLIQTFNNNQNCLEEPEENDKIAKRLFQDSPLFKDQDMRVVSKISLTSHQNSVDQIHNADNEFLKVQKKLQLPCQVLITKNFEPQGTDDNYIALKKGETLKLLRKIRENLWIGQYGEKIGLVQETYFQ